jgi:chromosome segregation ATPase
MIQVEQKDKSFLANIKSAIESKNDEFERLMHEKSKVLTSKYELEKDINELTLKYTKTHTELEFERKLSK